MPVTAVPLPCDSDSVAVSAAVARAVAYLRGRQSSTGGFCFYRMEGFDEPNLLDTYYAVASLHAAGVEIPYRDRIANFLRRFSLHTQVHGLYFRAFTWQLLGGTPEAEWEQLRREVDGFPIHLPKPPVTTLGLTELLFALKLKRHFSSPWEVASVAHGITGLEHPEGGFGAKPNIVDTHLAVAILAICEAMDRLERTRRFVARVQHREFGFQLTEDSIAPTLETLFSGIETVRILGLPIAYSPQTLQFALACQCQNGGFARAPVALPNIELTWQGISVLQTLDPMAREAR